MRLHGMDGEIPPASPTGCAAPESKQPGPDGVQGEDQLGRKRWDGNGRGAIGGCDTLPGQMPAPQCMYRFTGDSSLLLRKYSPVAFGELPATHTKVPKKSG